MTYHICDDCTFRVETTCYHFTKGGDQIEWPGQYGCPCWEPKIKE